MEAMPARRSLTRAAAVKLGAGAILMSAAGPVQADPLPPGCTTADMTGVMSGISAAMATYLFTHPDVNAFFSGLQGLPKTQVREDTEVYLNANPSVRADLEAIRAPSRYFRDRCNLPQRALILADLI
jgi:hemophore-related protein